MKRSMRAFELAMIMGFVTVTLSEAADQLFPPSSGTMVNGEVSRYDCQRILSDERCPG